MVDKDNPLFKGKLMPTDPAVIRAAIHKTYSHYKETLPSGCFLPERVEFLPSKGCVDRVGDLCQSLNSDGKGQLSVVTVESDLTTPSHPVDTPEEWNQVTSTNREHGDSSGEIYGVARDLIQTWVADTFYFCSAASASGQRFEAKVPSGPIPDPPAARFAVVDSLEAVKRECFDIDVMNVQANHLLLKIQFDGYYMAKAWEPAIMLRARRCQEAVQGFCQNAYLVKGEMILGYVTKGCEIREVTAEDVDNDIQRFTAIGMTRADRLNHGELRDQIDTCKTANEKGFDWSYQPPSLKDCHPSSGLEPK